MAAEPKNKLASSIRDHVLNMPDREEELVEVAGWGVTILVRSLTGAERAKFQKQTVIVQNGQQIIQWDRYWADLVILSAYDPADGSRIFEVTDRDMLQSKNAKNLEVVAAVARRLSGLDEQALPKSEGDAEE